MKEDLDRSEERRKEIHAQKLRLEQVSFLLLFVNIFFFFVILLIFFVIFFCYFFLCLLFFVSFFLCIFNFFFDLCMFFLVSFFLICVSFFFLFFPFFSFFLQKRKEPFSSLFNFCYIILLNKPKKNQECQVKDSEAAAQKYLIARFEQEKRGLQQNADWFEAEVCQTFFFVEREERERGERREKRERERREKGKRLKKKFFLFSFFILSLSNTNLFYKIIFTDENTIRKSRRIEKKNE